MQDLQNAARVIRVIETLASRQPMRLDDIAAELEVHKSNALRLLATLRNHGWVTVNSSRTHYSLGPGLVPIGQAAVPDIELSKALELAGELRDLSGETVHVSVVSGLRMVIVGKVESLNALRVSLDVGSTDLMHSTAVGKVALASMPDEELRRTIAELDLVASTPNTITDPDRLLEEVLHAREVGYALNLEEGRAGIASVAMSLSFGGGSSAFSISVTGPVERWTEDAIHESLPKVLELLEPYNYLRR